MGSPVYVIFSVPYIEDSDQPTPRETFNSFQDMIEVLHTKYRDHTLVNGGRFFGVQIAREFNTTQYAQDVIWTVVRRNQFDYDDDINVSENEDDITYDVIQDTLEHFIKTEHSSIEQGYNTLEHAYCDKIILPRKSTGFIGIRLIDPETVNDALEYWNK